jgi:hypothetical protein
MCASVTAGTAKGYEIAWRRWRIFVHAFTDTASDAAASDAMFIPSASSSTEQVCYILMDFADFLFREIHLSANRTCE